MKKILLVAIALLGANLYFASCSSKYDANPTVNNSGVRNPMQGDFTATIDGDSFIANEKTFTDTTDDNDIRYLSIVGLAYSADMDPVKSKTIALIIPNYLGPRSYAMDGLVTGELFISDSLGIHAYTTFPGDTLSLITLTDDGSTLEGSFYFRVLPAQNNSLDTISIANGSFKIPR